LGNGVLLLSAELNVTHAAARQSGCEDSVNLDEKVSPDA
jgi:hypothetical protein